MLDTEVGYGREAVIRRGHHDDPFVGSEYVLGDERGWH